MEIEAPYLKAIQAIGGTTPGEKQKTIHHIARQIAQAESSGDDSTNTGGQIPDVPEPLKPLVRVEVAKILHRYEGIIEALKSEDMTVVSRALQAKWFFDGSDTSFVNAKYFQENVFPNISLFTRLKIVKNFSIHLKNTSVAVDFFLTLSRQYGIGQAAPLLIVCDEGSAFKMIVDNEIVLSVRMMETLYQKYPNLVIKYLMLSKPDDNDLRNVHRLNVCNYRDFLPKLAVNHFKEFMEIYQMHDGIFVILGKRATNTFVETHLDLLVEDPHQYLKLLSLKTVTQKLSTDDFAKMLENLLPAEKEDFNYSKTSKYLQYYKSKEERILLVLDTFRKKYGKDLRMYKDLCDSYLIQELSTADRIKLAKIKLEDDKDWHFLNPELSWRCYLPTDESIPAIINAIAKFSDVEKRGHLLEQMILTSRINDDKDALLKVLNYVYDRHRNDQRQIFYNFLSLVCDSFDLATLSSAHWKILDMYIKLAEAKDELRIEADTISRVLEAALHHCLLNDTPINNYVDMLVDLKINTHLATWNILTKFPNLEKKFLDLFIEIIPDRYPSDNEIWKNRTNDVVSSLASSLWAINKRNKVSNKKFKRLSVNDYPWLLNKIKAYILTKTEEDYYWRNSVLQLIRENERDLYYILIYELDEFWAFDETVICDVLERQPQRVLDNWRECLKKVRGALYYRQNPSAFITKSRWYQQLPINFFNESLKKHDDPETRTRSMVTLALLMDGDNYSKIIEPFPPKESKPDVGYDEARNTHRMLLAIATNLRKLNPPISLDVIARFCDGNYLQTAIRSLTSVCRRLPIAKVIPFLKTLTHERVSVMKHGIRLIYLVAPLEEIYTFLSTLWDEESHTSIRKVIFTKTYDLFCRQPNPRSWRMIQTCIDDLKPNDDHEVFKILPRLSTIPNEYLYGYIKSALNALRSVQQESEDHKFFINLSCQLIENIDGSVVQILPEEYSQGLIKRYLFVFDYDSDIFKAGSNLTINSYLLASEKYNKSRFEFFHDFFRESVSQNWDKPHKKQSNFYPMNFMTQKFFNTIREVTKDNHDVEIFESLLKSFHSVLEPHQDAVTYLSLVYSIEYQKSDTWEDFGKRIAKKIPDLIKTFSTECVISMSHGLCSFMRWRAFVEFDSCEERLMTVIQVLANNGTIHCALFAADMLFNNEYNNLNEQHKNLVDTLRSFQHPAIFWYLNEHLATFKFCTKNHD